MNVEIIQPIHIVWSTAINIDKKGWTNHPFFGIIEKGK